MDERRHALAARTALKTERRPSKSLNTPQSRFFSLSYKSQVMHACASNAKRVAKANREPDTKRVDYDNLPVHRGRY